MLEGTFELSSTTRLSQITELPGSLHKREAFCNCEAFSSCKAFQNCEAFRSSVSPAELQCSSSPTVGLSSLDAFGKDGEGGGSTVLYSQDLCTALSSPSRAVSSRTAALPKV